jgi:formylglycine-generating enzyme
MQAARVGSVVVFAGLLFLIAAPACESRAFADFSTAPQAAPALKAAAAPAAPPAPAAAPALAEPCPDGMVEVEGDYCPTLVQTCKRFVTGDRAFPRRCAEFAPSGACQTKTVHKRFCIDRYEYPNKPGATPVVMKTWFEARDTCQAQGKRLCGGSEWTLACEGQQRLPYPYGLERSAAACNIDKPHPAVNEKALASAKTRDAEVARLWQGESSGARAECKSSYGVFDMTGNVDEWVVNEAGVPFKSGLKGGYWGPVRDRCRPMTTVHGEDFSFYQIGFRCCEDTTR